MDRFRFSYLAQPPLTKDKIFLANILKMLHEKGVLGKKRNRKGRKQCKLKKENPLVCLKKREHYQLK